ncbi:MAG: ADP-ribosylglycohydrolase family protein [Cyanobacteria bacterium]|nr:ADP-ribosylglycohydrolase family protein [Cyanobacteriota bacterium]
MPVMFPPSSQSFPSYRSLLSPVTSLRFGSDTSPTPDLKDQFLGCFLGLAVGDALGCNVETLTPEQIQQRHGVHTEITGGQATPSFSPWRKGETTDDTAMALLLAENLIQYPEGNFWDLKDRFVQWIKTDPPGTGKNTREVLKLAETMDPAVDSLDKASRQSYEILKRATNGSIMRCAPIGLLYYKNLPKLREFSEKTCMITHFAPECRASTLAFNLILAAQLRGEITDKGSLLQKIESAAQEVVFKSPETAQALRKIPTLTQEQLKTSSNTLDTLQVVLWTFHQFYDAPNPLETAVVKAVNLGGDTDTNGALVGALFGAKLGVGAIPPRWLNALLEREKIQQTAVMLHQVHERLSRE